MFKLTTSILCLTIALSAFAKDSNNEIAVEKQLQQDLSNYEAKLVKTKANVLFKQNLINKTLDGMHANVAEIEKMDPSMIGEGSSKADLISMIEKDTQAKVALMESLDPQSLKDMMIMDIQKAKTSKNLLFALTRSVITSEEGYRHEGYDGYIASYKNCKKYDKCGAALAWTAFAPIVLPAVFLADIVSLPVTLIVSAISGF